MQLQSIFALLGIAACAIATRLQPLYYIKTSNDRNAPYNPGGRVEIHRDDPTSNPPYTRGAGTIDVPTAFCQPDAAHGWWSVAGPDDTLYFIKTIDTRQDKVEVHTALHIAPHTSDPYAHIALEAVSAFSALDSGNGAWRIDGGGNLWFIKTDQTESGKIEVHRATAASQYATIDLHAASAFDEGEAGNGVWTIDGGDLYLVKTMNTASGHIEVHRASAASKYTSITVSNATYTEGDAANGVFTISHSDLYFFKTRNAPKLTEIHVVTGDSGYQTSIGDYGNVYSIDAGRNGWLVVPPL